jgi:hypothetical protein
VNTESDSWTPLFYIRTSSNGRNRLVGGRYFNLLHTIQLGLGE